jgi:hypothetical protein
MFQIIDTTRCHDLSPNQGEEEVPCSIAGIDVHKKVLVVVVAEVTEPGEWSYELGTFGATAYELQRLADWFQQRGCRKW